MKISEKIILKKSKKGIDKNASLCYNRITERGKPRKRNLKFEKTEENTMLKVKIDKNYTKDFQVERVKEAIKEFKEMYTEKDLLALFRSEFEWHENWCCEIVKCEIKAFDAGTFYNNETAFAIEMLLEGFSEIDKIRFYYTTGFGVNTAKDMHTIEIFRK